MTVSRRRIAIALSALPLVGIAAAYVWRHFSGPSSPEHADRVTRVVVDRLLPAGELPGGIALGIDKRFDDLAAVAPKVDVGQLREIVTAGIEWLDGRAQAEGADGFLTLGEERQQALLAAAFASDDTAGRRFMVAMRQRALSLYYSESVIEARFAYTGPPQPEGFPDFEAPPQRVGSR
jgi:hypothetical protein